MTDVSKQCVASYYTCGMLMKKAGRKIALLFYRPLESDSKSEDIFLNVNEFFTTADLQWENCLQVHGTGKMLGKRAEFVAKVKKTCYQVTFTH